MLIAANLLFFFCLLLSGSPFVQLKRSRSSRSGVFRTVAVHLTPVLVVIGLLAGCSSVPSGASESASQGQNIVDLVEQKLIAVSITGVSMDAVALHVTSISAKPLQVQIPAGTYFVAENPSEQNMVSRHATSASIDAGAVLEVKVDAACASLHLAAPSGSDTFAMLRASKLPEVTKVIDQLNTTEVEYPVEQAAIWIVTDDASYDELGMLVGGSPFGSPLIQEEDAARAMMLVDQAGVDISKYSIWRDRSMMQPKVTAPDLVAWLDKQEEAAATEFATATGIEVTAEPTAGASGPEISQFARQAVGSSELSAADWSAMQAAGAPNTEGCGDLPTAWSSGHSMPGATLQLLYDKAVIPTRIVIYETYNPGAIFMVEAAGSAVYQESPTDSTKTAECPHKMIIDIKDVNYPVNFLELTLDQENEAWDEIDAVELIGVAP